MSEHTHRCPPWLGYFLINPCRRLFENPTKMLSPYVEIGMTVVELGPGMGFFTLPLARMVGATGKVIAVDVEAKMLKVLRRRAKKAGVEDIVETRQATEESLGLADLTGNVDFAPLIHVAHEVLDQARMFEELFAALRSNGRILFVEPKGHVSVGDFNGSLDLAKAKGFTVESVMDNKRTALLRR